ncbi:MAG: hypothetical protein ABSE77_17075, partial [Acidimicrobiales bacterium]
MPFMALTLVTEAPATASGATLYAYANGTGTPAGCPPEGTPSTGCSLLEAITRAVAGDTIELATAGSTPYIGNWTIDTTGTSAASPITIEPASGSTAVLDGNDGSATNCTTTSCAGPVLTIGRTNVVYVDISGLAANGLTIENGDNSTPTPAGPPGSGAGSGTEALGGGIDNTWGGVLTVTDTLFQDNTANFGGAIINANGDDVGTGTLTVIGSTFTDNHAVTGDGGAINSAGGGAGATGTLTVTGSTFTGNTATGTTVAHGDGGAIDNGDESSSNGTMTVSSSTFTDNTAVDGAAIDNGDNGGNGGSSGTPNTVTGSTFTGNSANGGTATQGDGAAIDNADLGGHGYLTVTNSTFMSNTAVSDAASAPANGGALDNADNAGNGHVTVSGSTFDDNTTNANSSGANANGSAIDNADEGGTGTLTVSASTFDGNSGENAAFGSHGGAIDNADDGGTGTLTVTAATFDNNTASDGSAIDNDDFGGTGAVAVAADIFTGSCNSNEQGTGHPTWTDGGYNVGPDGTCDNSGTEDVANASSLGTELGPLQINNGGATETIQLLAGNPGLGLIGTTPHPVTVTLNANAVTLCPTTDQNGTTTASDIACDAGALQSSSLKTQTITFSSANPSPVTVGATYTPTATEGASGNAVTFSIDAASTAGACSYASPEVTFNAAGTCIVDANEAGNGTYAQAEAQQSITVNAAAGGGGGGGGGGSGGGGGGGGGGGAFVTPTLTVTPPSPTIFAGSAI